MERVRKKCCFLEITWKMPCVTVWTCGHFSVVDIDVVCKINKLVGKFSKKVGKLLRFIAILWG